MAGGNTRIFDTNDGHTLDFSSTTLTDIAEVNAAGGNDTITFSNLSAGTYRGGWGNDTFHASSSGSEEDVILDFVTGQDKIVLSTGTTFSAAEDLGGVLLTLSSGQKIRLAGLTLAQFNGPTDVIWV